jgi:outer membrane protein OmpA-like peptidoglycan-associated protein
MKRRAFLTALAACAAAPGAFAAPLEFDPAIKSQINKGLKIAMKPSKQAPTVQAIEKSLKAKPALKITPSMKGSMSEIKRRKALRHLAPSIDIQAINFSFGSANIPADEHWKVERIAAALHNILGYNPDEIFLIEGHTDAVGSYGSNLRLSRRRARSLRRVLTQYYGVPRFVLETVGYGEEDLLVPTPYPDWRNRRVTLRRVTDIVYQ